MRDFRAVWGGALTSGPRLLVIVAPLRLTLWVLAIGTAVIVVLVAIGVSRHLARARASRRRERVRNELEPVFSRFLETEDRVRLAEELRPAFMRMDAAHRPVAAVLVTDIMGQATWSQGEQLRSALEEAGIVELGHLGTRRLSPWRRALACEMLGKIGSPSSVPVVLERRKDRRPEVRMAAVRALGDIGSAEAVPRTVGGIPRAPRRADQRHQCRAAQDRRRGRTGVRAGRAVGGSDRQGFVVLRALGDRRDPWRRCASAGRGARVGFRCSRAGGRSGGARDRRRRQRTSRAPRGDH
ncbi:MAG: HEAT repeat domain-containing protein [Solirubrobacterales bacterium]|nr:HEAT repeat domain-containing protein [Solirubrobacterales bacterium]